MKILINCYICSPYRGSEPGMGWNFIKCLSKRHELHIIVEEQSKGDLVRYFEENPEEKDFYHFYFLKREMHFTLWKIWPPSYYWSYKTWQKKALLLATQLDKIHNFDLVHQLNMVGYREPGFLWRMNKPFVWGPIGGFNITPWRMLFSMGLYGAVFYASRNLLNLWQMRTKLRVRKAMEVADGIISATKECQTVIERLYNRKSIIISEVGLVSTPTQICLKKRKNSEPLRLCWSGQHTPRKSLNLLLDALFLIRDLNIELHVIGEGRETQRWMQKAASLGLENIKWHGWVEHEVALNIMRNSHCFVITSMSDLTSTVLLEALSFGLPVISVDHCGFSNVITESCGIKVKINTPRQVSKDISTAIEYLEKNENQRFILAQGALSRANDYLSLIHI